MKARTVSYILKEGFGNLWHNRVMTFAAVISVIASLIILGLFTSIVLNVNNIASQMESKLVLKAFLTDNLSRGDLNNIKTNIDCISGITSVTYESKGQALKEYRQQLGKNAYLLNGFEKDNPLPQSYTIKVSDPKIIKNVANEISKIKGVNEVNYGEDVVDKLIRITSIVKIICAVLMAVLAVVSVVIISNTIKLAVYARRKEINIMKYIGATDWFIRWPFILEGLLLGFIGAVISIAVVGYAYYYFIQSVNRQAFIFNMISYNNMMPEIVRLFILLGCTIGVLGSGLSVRKFLRV